nr:hypothetical protein [Nakamurella multipartita]
MTVNLREELAYMQRIVISWNLLAEAARRHPSGEIAHDWHHWYDSLQFVIDSEHAILCNRAGGIHLLTPGNFGPWEPRPSGDGWGYAQTQGIRKTVRDFENVIGLPSPKHTPKTTERTLVYRILAAICSISMIHGVLLDPRPGMIYDSNDYGSGIEEDQFSLFPLALKLLDGRGPDRRVDASKDFWFLVPRTLGSSESEAKGQALGVLHTSGQLWTRNGAEISLVTRYDEISREFALLAGETFAVVTQESELFQT